MQDLVGQRIRLLDMPYDPAPVPKGTEGLVRRVTKSPFSHSEWIVDVAWDNGRGLSMLTPHDTYEVISHEEAPKEEGQAA